MRVLVVLLAFATPAFAHETAQAHTHGMPVGTMVLLAAGAAGLIWFALARTRRRGDGSK